MLSKERVKEQRRRDPKNSSDNILGMSLNPKTNIMMSSTLVSLINQAKKQIQGLPLGS